MRGTLLGGVSLLVGMLFLSGCSVTTVRQHPDFAQQKKEVRRIAVITPDVEFVRIVLDGNNERLVEQEKEICSTLGQCVTDKAAEKGYEIKSVDWAALLQQEPELAFELEKLRQSSQEAMKQLYQEGGAVAEDKAFNCRVSLGSSVNLFAEKADVDALLFTNFKGTTKSGGVIAKDVTTSILVGVLTMGAVIPVASVGDQGRMYMLLADGTTGDVLWSNFGGAEAKPEAIANGVIAPLPAPVITPATTKAKE